MKMPTNTIAGMAPTNRSGEVAMPYFAPESAHADDFLRAEVRGNKCQPADPGGNGAACEEKVRACLHRAFQGEADAHDKGTM